MPGDRQTSHLPREFSSWRSPGHDGSKMTDTWSTYFFQKGALKGFGVGAPNRLSHNGAEVLEARLG